jgi:hypothetical protein
MSKKGTATKASGTKSSSSSSSTSYTAPDLDSGNGYYRKTVVTSESGTRYNAVIDGTGEMYILDRKKG